MVHTRLRFKINLSMVLTALFFVATMWCFNTEVLNHDWPGAIRDLPFVGAIIAVIVVVAVFVNFFGLRPLVSYLKKIEQGGAPEPAERGRALGAMLRLPLVIIMLTVLGFFLGPLGRFIPRVLSGSLNLFSPIPLLTMFYNAFIGFVCALTCILEHSVLLANAKRLMNVTSREKISGRRVTDLSLRAKNILYPFGLALLFGAMLGVAGFSYYSREVRLTQTGAVADGKEAGLLIALGILFALLAGITLTLSLFFSGETSSYLKRFSNNLSEILDGHGDLSQRLSLVQFNELGDLAILYNRFIEKLQTLLLEVKKEAAETAVSSEVIERFIEECARAMADISSGAAVVDADCRKQTEAVEAARRTIGEILSSVEEVKGNVETQAASIEQSSSAIHELSSSIGSVSSTAEEARKASDALVALARDGEDKVARAIVSMEGIEKASRVVTDITDVISRIAGQTNLLAMNASIEAAHAGSFGKGFSVVADEVRKLAEESAESVVQIGREIGEMSNSIATGSAFSRETGEALKRISDDINRNTQMMVAIAHAMEEQNIGSREILTSVTSIVETTQHIKLRTGEQVMMSNEIRAAMDVLVAASAEIRSAAAAQDQSLAALKKAIDNVNGVAVKNREVVNGLTEAVGRFTV